MWIIIDFIILLISTYVVISKLDIDLKSIWSNFKALIFIVTLYKLFFFPLHVYGDIEFIRNFGLRSFYNVEIFYPTLFGYIHPLTLFLGVYLFLVKENEIGKYLIFISLFLTIALYLFNSVRGITFWAENIFMVASFLVSTLVNVIFLRGAYLMKDDLNNYQPVNENSEKDFLPTFLLCLFFGTIGVHRFYVGKMGTGILMIFTIGGIGIWVIVDLILILIGSFRDINGRVIKYSSEGNQASSSISAAEEIKKLSELKDQGILTEEEFNKKKEILLNL